MGVDEENLLVMEDVERYIFTSSRYYVEIK